MQPRWVKAFAPTGRDTRPARTYYYFKRRSFPCLRLTGEPGSVEFERAYAEALAATNNGELEIRKLRGSLGMRPLRKPRRMLPLHEALWNWARKEPITQQQAEMLADRFDVPLEMIARDHTILPSTKH